MKMDADVLAQIHARLTGLLWLVGLSMAWNTLLTGAAVGVLLTSRAGRRQG
jgi:hypothetical protein